MESSPFHTDHDVFCEVKTTNLDQNLGNLSADLFEEKLEEINRDLRRFDAITELHSKSNSSMGKENNLESMTINEIFLKSTQLCAAPSGLSRVPLFTISKTTNINTGNSSTWKRLARSTLGIDVIMAETVGSKRSARHTGSQSELQKKKKFVSQDGKGNNLILVEAGS